MENIENSLFNDDIWEPPRRRLLECGCEEICHCDDGDEDDL